MHFLAVRFDLATFIVAITVWTRIIVRTRASADPSQSTKQRIAEGPSRCVSAYAQSVRSSPTLSALQGEDTSCPLHPALDLFVSASKLPSTFSGYSALSESTESGIEASCRPLRLKKPTWSAYSTISRDLVFPMTSRSLFIYSRALPCALTHLCAVARTYAHFSCLNLLL